jgi:hypothetical protein
MKPIHKLTRRISDLLIIKASSGDSQFQSSGADVMSDIIIEYREVYSLGYAPIL